MKRKLLIFLIALSMVGMSSIHPMELDAIIVHEASLFAELRRACISGDGAAVTRLLDYVGNSARGLYDHTPLHYAAAHNRQEIINLLLERKADVLAKTSYGWTALHFAAYYGYANLVELLAECKDVQDSEGNTPAHIAALKGHTPVLKQLMYRGADVFKENYRQKSVIDCAADPRSIEFMTKLVETLESELLAIVGLVDEYQMGVTTVQS
jgi:ankyrin repeat protein